MNREGDRFLDRAHIPERPRLPDSSDDDILKTSPLYVGSKRGWTELHYPSHENWITRLVNRNSARYQKHNKIMQRMRVLVSKANRKKFPWISSPSYVKFKPGEEVEIADESITPSNGNVFKVRFEGGAIVLPGKLLRLIPEIEEDRIHDDLIIDQLVQVEKRTWAGINKEGGVGKIVGINPAKYSSAASISPDDLDYESDVDLHVTYDVKYILGGRERGVAAKFISPTDLMERHAPSKRSTQGRCRLPNCTSFIVDCKHVQPDEKGIVPGERVHAIGEQLWRELGQQVLRSDHMMHWEKDEIIFGKEQENATPVERAEKVMKSRSKGQNKRTGTTKRRRSGQQKQKSGGMSPPSAKSYRKMIQILESDDSDICTPHYDSSNDWFSHTDVDEEDMEEGQANTVDSKPTSNSITSCVQGEIHPRVPFTSYRPLVQVTSSSTPATACEISLPRASTTGSVGAVIQSVSSSLQVLPTLLAPGPVLISGTAEKSLLLSTAKAVSATATTSIDASEHSLYEDGRHKSVASPHNDVKSTHRAAFPDVKKHLFFRNRDINSEPSDRRPYLRQVLMGLTREETLITLTERLNRLEQYIQTLAHFKTNAIRMYQNFRKRPEGMSVEDLDEQFDLEATRYHTFLLKVQHKSIDVCNVIFKRLDDDEKYSMYVTRMTTLMGKYDELRLTINKLYDAVAGGIIDDLSCADSESESEGSQSSTEDVDKNPLDPTPVIEYLAARSTSKRQHQEMSGGYSSDGTSSNMSFISNRDDVFGSLHSSQRLKSGHMESDPGVSISEPPDSLADFIVDDLDDVFHQSSTRNKSTVTSSGVSAVYKSLDAFVVAMATNSVLGMPMDFLCDDCSNPLFIMCQTGRAKADSKKGEGRRLCNDKAAADKLQGILACISDNSVRGGIDIVFSRLERLCGLDSSPVLDVPARREFFSHLHVAERIWKVHAINDAALCQAFLARCSVLEVRLLNYLYCSPEGHKDGPLESWIDMAASTKSVRKFGLFTFLRQKALWISYGLHAVLARSQEGIFRELLDSALHTTGVLVAFGMTLHCIALKDLTGLVLNLFTNSPSARTPDGGEVAWKEVRVDDMGLLAAHQQGLDILMTAINIHHVEFGDILRLCDLTCDTESDRLSTNLSELKHPKWDHFNSHMLDVQLLLLHSSSINRCVATLSSYLSSVSSIKSKGTIPRIAILSGNKTTYPVSYEGQKWLDNAYWVATIMHSYVLYSTSPIISSASTSISVIANWKRVKETTKQIYDSAALSVWMGRVSMVLCLWSDASVGYDIFQDLVTRLISEVPWSPNSSPIHQLAVTYDIPDASGDLGGLEAAGLKAFHRVKDTCRLDERDTHALLDSFFTLLGERPPDRSASKWLSSMDYGYVMISAATNLFRNGMQHIPPTSLQYRRVLKRTYQIHNVWQSGRNGSTNSTCQALILIEMVCAGRDCFGEEFLSPQLVENLTKLLMSMGDTVSSEHVLVNFNALFRLFVTEHGKAPKEGALISTIATYVHQALMAELRDAVLAVGRGHVASRANRASCVLILVLCMTLLGNVQRRAFLDADVDIISSIILWSCQAINPDFYAIKPKSLTGPYIEMGLVLLAELSARLLQHSVDPNHERPKIVERVLITQKDILSTLRAVFADLITECRSQKHCFRNQSEWKHALSIVTILSRLFLLTVRFESASSLVNCLRNTLEVLNAIKGIESDYPLDIWLLGAFWGQVLPSMSDFQAPNRDAFLKSLDQQYPSMFLCWLGCLGSIFVETGVIADTAFSAFHESMLSPALLQRNGGTKCLFTLSCLRLTCVASYSASGLRHFTMEECTLCLYHILISCSVSVNLRPNTEKSKLKASCKPIRDTLERCAEFLRARVKAKETVIFRQALHTIQGPLLAGAMASLTEVDSMSRLFNDVNLAHIQHSVKTYYVNFSRRGRPPEPTNDVVQFTRCVRSYVAATSFFPFSNAFLAWKPFLGLLLQSRVSGNCDIRRFFTRLWASSLLSVDDIDSADIACTLPFTWKDAYRGEDLSFSSFPAPATIALFELENPNKPPVSASLAPNPYEQRATSIAPTMSTISSEYNNLQVQINAKLQVFKHYILTFDDVWINESIGLQTDSTCARIDLTIDFCYLLRKAPITKQNEDILGHLACPFLVLISHILCLRLVLISLGESVSAVVGNVIDRNEDVLKQCVESIVICEDVIRSAKQLGNADIKSHWTIAVRLAVDFAKNQEINQTVENSALIAISASAQTLGEILREMDLTSRPGQKKISQSLIWSEWDRLLEMLHDISLRPQRGRIVYNIPKEQLGRVYDIFIYEMGSE